MRTVLITTLALVCAHPAAAQVIRGRTIDAASGAWVPATLVTLLTASGDSAGATVTDDAALFRITAPSSGSYTLRAERIGYAVVNTPVIVLGTGEAVTVEVLLGADPVELEPLTVTSRRYEARGVLAGHHRRADWIQRTGIGDVITRADLDEQPRPFVSDYFFTVPGMRVTGTGHNARVYMRGCQPQIFVDGMRTPGLSVNAIHPDAIEGIEVYRSISEVPPELRGIGSCGAISMYTRAGEPTRGQWTLLQKIVAGVGATALGVLIFTQF